MSRRAASYRSWIVATKRRSKTSGVFRKDFLPSLERSVQGLAARIFGFVSNSAAKIFVLRNIRVRCSVYDDDTMYRMTWTDQRMDDFAEHVDQRFDTVDERLGRLEDRFDGLQRTLIATGGGIIATLIAGFVSIVVTQL